MYPNHRAPEPAIDEQMRQQFQASVDEETRAALEAAVWRAVAETVARQNAALDADLREITKAIRKAHHSLPTAVVPLNFPIRVEWDYPVHFVRSPNVPDGTAYIIPPADQLDDLFAANGIEP